ncbi:MAG: ABC transporter permease, partial [Acholeplasmataceae bacterium]|nr:ABC transporter permease [Acholeplasmataceae bacterium]
MKLAFQIAWRFLASAKRQTLIIVLGISVGVSVQVFIGSLITGLQKSLVDSTIGSSSHITVINETESEFIDDYLAKMDMIASTSEQIGVVSPVLDLGGILEKGELKKEVLYRGFDINLANEIYAFEMKLTEGSGLPVEINDIILGVGLKNELSLEIGNTIDIDILGNMRTLTVVGFFDFNVAVINRSWGVGIIETLQDIVGDTNKVSSIEMQIKDVFEAENLSLALDVTLASEGLK